MLKTTLLHPELIEALARGGHGDRILVADGNYPLYSGAAPGARRVHLNLARDIVLVPQVLRVLLDAVPVEHALLMGAPDGVRQPIHAEVEALLGDDVPRESLPRHAFYEAARAAATCLAIGTGESRRFGNVLLTIGVVR